MSRAEYLTRFRILPRLKALSGMASRNATLAVWLNPSLWLSNHTLLDVVPPIVELQRQPAAPSDGDASSAVPGTSSSAAAASDDRNPGDSTGGSSGSTLVADRIPILEGVTFTPIVTAALSLTPGTGSSCDTRGNGYRAMVPPRSVAMVGCASNVCDGPYRWPFPNGGMANCFASIYCYNGAQAWCHIRTSFDTMTFRCAVLNSSTGEPWLDPRGLPATSGPTWTTVESKCAPIAARGVDVPSVISAALAKRVPGLLRAVLTDANSAFIVPALPIAVNRTLSHPVFFLDLGTADTLAVGRRRLPNETILAASMIVEVATESRRQSFAATFGVRFDQLTASSATPPPSSPPPTRPPPGLGMVVVYFQNETRLTDLAIDLRVNASRTSASDGHETSPPGQTLAVSRYQLGNVTFVEGGGTPWSGATLGSVEQWLLVAANRSSRFDTDAYFNASSGDGDSADGDGTSVADHSAEATALREAFMVLIAANGTAFRSPVTKKLPSLCLRLPSVDATPEMVTSCRAADELLVLFGSAARRNGSSHASDFVLGQIMSWERRVTRLSNVTLRVVWTPRLRCPQVAELDDPPHPRRSPVAWFSAVGLPRSIVSWFVGGSDLSVGASNFDDMQAICVVAVSNESTQTASRSHSRNSQTASGRATSLSRTTHRTITRSQRQAVSRSTSASATTVREKSPDVSTRQMTIVPNSTTTQEPTTNPPVAETVLLPPAATGGFVAATAAAVVAESAVVSTTAVGPTLLSRLARVQAVRRAACMSGDADDSAFDVGFIEYPFQFPLRIGRSPLTQSGGAAYEGMARLNGGSFVASVLILTFHITLAVILRRRQADASTVDTVSSTEPPKHNELLRGPSIAGAALFYYCLPSFANGLVAAKTFVARFGWSGAAGIVTLHVCICLAMLLIAVYVLWIAVWPQPVVVPCPTRRIDPAPPSPGAQKEKEPLPPVPLGDECLYQLHAEHADGASVCPGGAACRATTFSMWDARPGAIPFVDCIAVYIIDARDPRRFAHRASFLLEALVGFAIGLTTMAGCGASTIVALCLCVIQIVCLLVIRPYGWVDLSFAVVFALLQTLVLACAVVASHFDDRRVPGFNTLSTWMASADLASLIVLFAQPIVSLAVEAVVKCRRRFLGSSAVSPSSQRRRPTKDESISEVASELRPLQSQSRPLLVDVPTESSLDAPSPTHTTTNPLCATSLH